MATARQFEDLSVWQEARQLVGAIYTASRQRSFNQDFGLRDQIRRAAVSTMSNIAKGSNGEVRSQLYVALEQKYITEKEFTTLSEAAVLLSRKLAAFIHYLEGCTGNSRVRKPATCNLQPPTR